MRCLAGCGPAGDGGRASDAAHRRLNVTEIARRSDLPLARHRPPPRAPSSSRPHLQDLRTATGYTVHLVVRDGVQALVGKVLLAWAPAEVRRDTLAGRRELRCGPRPPRSVRARGGRERCG